MTARTLDGAAVARAIREELKGEAAALARDGRRPGLGVLLVGDDPASAVYVKSKARACDELGLFHETHHLPATATTADVLAQVEAYNRRRDVHGILVQLPLPPQVDTERVLRAVDPAKDVDGFHPENVGLLVQKRPRFVACTPAGIMELLRREGVELAGRRAVVVGRSDIVGKPMALLLMHADATVTVCHSRTRDLAAVTREADILVAAVGRAKLVGAAMVKPGACVIDVGINRLPDGKLTGDVDPAAAERAAALTPVPGGVGPMTIAMLLENCITAASKQ